MNIRKNIVKPCCRKTAIGNLKLHVSTSVKLLLCVAIFFSPSVFALPATLQECQSSNYHPAAPDNWENDNQFKLDGGIFTSAVRASRIKDIGELDENGWSIQKSVWIKEFQGKGLDLYSPDEINTLFWEASNLYETIQVRGDNGRKEFIQSTSTGTYYGIGRARYLELVDLYWDRRCGSLLATEKTRVEEEKRILAEKQWVLDTPRREAQARKGIEDAKQQIVHDREDKRIALIEKQKADKEREENIAAMGQFFQLIAERAAVETIKEGVHIRNIARKEIMQEALGITPEKESHEKVISELEPVVLLPLRLNIEDGNLRNTMEVSIAQGLGSKYKVIWGGEVESKVIEIFRSGCEEKVCLQHIATYFHVKLLSVAQVNKTDEGYFATSRLINIFTSTTLYARSYPCKGCDSMTMVGKLTGLATP